MDSLVGLTIPAAIILLELDVPTLTSYMKMSEEELSHLFPTGFAQEVKKVLAEKHFVHALCKKFDLDLTDNYEDFERMWLLHALFHKKNELKTIVENYERVFRLTKALKKAAKVSRFDFVNEILTSKRLWCSFRHVLAVSRGCCWSKAKVDHYMEKFLTKHSKKLEEEVEMYGEGETGTDVNALCKYRATLKGYRNSGYEIDQSALLTQLFLYQRWDLLRERLKELDGEGKFCMSLPADCLEYGKGVELFWRPELVPEDLRQYILYEEIDREDLDHVKFKSVQLLADKLDFACELHFIYGDRVQNAHKSNWISDSKFENTDGRDLVDFASAYITDPELDAELMPNFTTSTQVEGSESDDGYEEKFEPTVNGNHPERCAEFVIWCYEQGLNLKEDFCPTMEANREYVFELLLESDQFGEGNAIYADWYDPLSLQYFCDNHLEAFSVFAGGKDKLKQRLLQRVACDELMEAYVHSLSLF